MIGLAICCYAVIAALASIVSVECGLAKEEYIITMNEITMIVAVLGGGISIVELIVAII